MTRTTVAIAWLGAAVAVAVAPAGALGLNAEADLGGASAKVSTSEGITLTGPSLPLAGPRILELDLSGPGPNSQAPPDEPASGPSSSPESIDAVGSAAAIAPVARDAATAATAATGLALLAALVAYHWGSLKVASLGLLAPLFSRIQSNHLLDNDVRHRVNDAVAHNPGITIKEIAMVCGIGWGTAVYHLKRLEAERVIVSERQRQFRRYFKNGGGIVNDSKSAFGELKSPTGARIAESIVRDPGSCQKELCERVGISAPLAHKYLVRLEEAGLVASQREWRTVKYFPTPRLEDLLPAARPASAAAPLAVAA